MPKITKIDHKPEKERYWIYVDGAYCTSIRDRTFPALNLNVGDELSCEKIKDMESFHWKNMYGQKAWEKEKVRLNKVHSLIESIDTRIEAVIVGFGADSTDLIPEHPEESGKPDIEVRLRDTKAVLIFVEVTGTEIMRGGSYWVRPDKLAYTQAHADDDVWIILHFVQPTEKFIFIKPILGKAYAFVEKQINGSTEHYVEFWDQDDEVVSFDIFKNHLLELIKNHT